MKDVIGATHLVEVDVHTLELELGGTVVAILAVSGGSAKRHQRCTYTPLLSRPCSPEMVCLLIVLASKPSFASIAVVFAVNLPESSTDLVTLEEPVNTTPLPIQITILFLTYALAGLEMNLLENSSQQHVHRAR